MEQVAQTGEKKNVYINLVGKPDGIYHSEDLSIYGII
jgi:hypothetical protein